MSGWNDILFSGHAAWFAVPALLGTAVFLLRLVFMLLGGAGLDLHHDFGLDVHHGLDGAHHDGDAGFKVLSIQSIAAFLMGFGWGGLAGLKGTHWQMLTSIAVGVACGVAMMWLLGVLLKAAYDLQSSGNIRINEAVGAEGDVYVTVPEHGTGRGQVMLVLGDRQCTYNAVSSGPALVSRSRVRVIGVNDDNTVTVAPA
jgi:hypothetical protein